MVAVCRPLVSALLLALAAHVSAQPAEEHTRYLAFQMFTDRSALFGGSSAQPVAVTRAEMSAWVRDLAQRIGTPGNRDRKLGFVVGPLALAYPDDELRRVIADAFVVALEHDVAVGFHIDDSLFWGRRNALANDPRNVEWLDWNGTPTPAGASTGTSPRRSSILTFATTAQVSGPRSRGWGRRSSDPRSVPASSGLRGGIGPSSSPA
jgi:hypothetical protein